MFLSVRAPNPDDCCSKVSKETLGKQVQLHRVAGAVFTVVASYMARAGFAGFNSKAGQRNSLASTAQKVTGTGGSIWSKTHGAIRC